MATDFASLRDEYARRWTGMVIQPTKVGAFLAAANRILKVIDRYKAVEKRTGVPAAVIAVINERESSGNFDTYLGDGEPLGQITKNVPKGRGPFKTWEDGAIDALKLQGMDKVSPWTIERACYELERYNGLGYRNKGLPSPYLWAGSNQYQSGKFVADGKFSATTVDKQLGTVPLLKTLFDLDPSLAIDAKPKAPPAEVTVPGGSAVIVGTGMVQAGLPLWQIVIGVAAAAIIAFAVTKFLKRK